MGTLSALTYNYYTIKDLKESSTYYIRVSAANSMGFGPAVSTLPIGVSPSVSHSQIHPLSATPQKMEPGKPTSLALSVGAKDITTGKSSITVSWNAPKTPWHGIPCNGSIALPGSCPGLVADGGSTIKSYLLDYDVDPSFNTANARHIEVAATSSNLDNTYGGVHVITQTMPNIQYYVRVFAKNDIGFGPATSTEVIST